MKQSEKEKNSKLPTCYIDAFYSSDKHISELAHNRRPIASFPGKDTYELVKETNVHAHPLCKGYPSNVAPFIMLRAEGGVSDSLFQVMKTVDVQPHDKAAVNELASIYPNVFEYINKRLHGRGFDKAPVYRFYVLRKAYSYKPIFRLGYNPQGLIYLSFSDAKIQNPESLITDSVSAFEEYKKFGMISNTDYKKIENECSLIEDSINQLNLEGEDRCAFIKTRINQSYFRDLLIKRYKKCCLCGMDDKNLLLASHIKPWADSSGTEKIDVNNGLLLCPNHDKLFDKGYISFDENGMMIVSRSLNVLNQVLMNVNDEMRITMTDATNKYMQYHRDNIYKN